MLIFLGVTKNIKKTIISKTAFSENVQMLSSDLFSIYCDLISMVHFNFEGRGENSQIILRKFAKIFVPFKAKNLLDTFVKFEIENMVSG